MEHAINRYIPKDSTERRFDHIPAVVYYSGTPEKPCAMGYSGKRGKHDFYLTFKSVERRQAYIDNWLDGLMKHAEFKAEQKIINKGKSSSHAGAAAAIKAELKAAYPTIKFSVTSESFSMGDAVRIHWNLGPTVKQVEEITNRYQYGSFNGMEDIYEYTNTRKDIPQAKYVTCSRYFKSTLEIEAEKQDKRRDLWKEEATLTHTAWKDLCKIMNIPYEGQYTTIPEDYKHIVSGHYNPTISDMLYQIEYKTPLMDGYHGVKEENGRIEIY